jgi:phage tail protein X
MADQSFIVHTTADGERWDTIADRYYGDPYAYVQIIEANPNAPVLPVLPAGKQLLIPIVAASDSLSADLPPWKTA